jgi:hypothetical protein
MAEFTFLKLQLDDASFTANAPLSGGEGEEANGEETDSGGSGSVSILPFFVGLLFLILVAVAVKKFLGGDDELPEPQDD